MANWQYSAPNDQAPVVPIDQGYFVSFPHKGIANSTNHTARLTSPSGAKAYLWVHDIVMNFQVAGAYAQSHRWRQWYPRNFVQPRITITGQTPNQREYGRLCEFIRVAQ